MHIDNQQFLRALTYAILCLVASALVLYLLAFIQAGMRIPAGANTTHAKAIPTTQFRTIFGTIDYQDQSLRIEAMQNRDGGLHALATARVRPFSAENYPLLSFDLSGLNPSQSINFIWRGGNGRLSTTRLDRQLGGRSLTQLSSIPSWQGTISEIGFHIQGDLRSTPLTLSQVELLPHGRQSALKASLLRWTAFQGWSPSSINVLYGAAAPQKPSPTTAAAAWAALALALLLLLRKLFKRPVPGMSYGLVMLLAWMALDVLWQRDLSIQASETAHLFAGKSTHEKHIADVDGPIYQYATRLQSEVLPTGIQRIFILHTSIGHSSERMKTQYYLLPNNIYNYGSVPPSVGVLPGDYILALGQLPDLHYRDGGLSWGSDRHLRVELIDEDPRGVLYRVAATQPITPGPGGGH